MSIRNAFALLTLGTLPFLTACGGGEAPKPEAPPATTAPKADAPAAPAAGAASGAITGKVTFEGTVPPADKIKVGADPKCLALNPNGLERQPIKVKDGGLADVVIYVKSPVSGTFSAPTTPVLLDQNGCTYHPHVIAMQAGQPLTIRNSDETLHNIHPRPTINAEFNVGQARKGMEMTKTFEKPEPWITVGCDVHPWMRSYIAVVPHPYFAVTGEDGSFTIKGLPDGDYEIEAIHEKLKTQTQKVSVKGGQATLNITYKG
jgi:plastocyanin